MYTAQQEQKTELFSRTANMETVDVETLLRRAHEVRAQALAGMTKATVKWVAKVLGDWLVHPVATVYRREKLRAQLESLNTRMLSDIGLARSEIPELLDRSFPLFPEGHSAHAVAKVVSDWTTQPVKALHNRAALRRELELLNDDALNDVGLAYSDIPALARRSFPVFTRDHSAHALARAASWVAHLAATLLERRTLRAQFEEMDDRMLRDIGLTRGDIPEAVRLSFPLSKTVRATGPATMPAMAPLPQLRPVAAMPANDATRPLAA